MTPRARVIATVAVAACIAAGGVVGLTVLQTRGKSTTAPGAVTKPRAGIPPLFLDFGIRDDAQTRELQRAATRPAQLDLLSRAARAPDVQAKLRYGLALWKLWHRVSAERQFAAAVKLAPNDPAARAAAAVALFTKRAPVRAFSKLGPLTG